MIALLIEAFVVKARTSVSQLNLSFNLYIFDLELLIKALIRYQVFYYELAYD